MALFEGPLAPDEWVELGNSVEARIQLDHERGRQGFAEQMRTHVIQDAKALLDLVQLSQPSAPANRTGTGSAAKGQRDPIVPEATIEERIAALHPWQYPVTIEDATVQPGVGSGADPATIANRVAARSTLLVQELVARVDFRGKSILDLGCNCGFWSSFYAMAGANHVLGVDRDLRQVAQAELYWGANRFLPIHSYEFMQADFSQSSAWLAIREQGEVDIAVCVGALHQVENHTEALGWIAEATREFIILDTRVHHEPEGSGPVHVPNQAQLLQTLGDLGLETEILTPGFVDPVETAPSDSYSTGSRVVILARRTP